MNRRALVLLAIAYFFAFGSVGVQMPLAAPALLGAGFSAAVVGAMWAARSLTGTLAPPLWGALADRVGQGRLFAALSLGLGGLVFTALAVAGREASALALFALYGLVGGASTSLLDGMTLTALGPHKRRYGNVRLFGAVGFGVTALSASTLVDAGWLAESAEVVFPMAGGLSVAAAVFVALTPRLERPRMARFGELLTAVRRGRLVAVGALSLLHWASHGAYTALVTPLAEARGAGRAAVGVALLVGIVVEVAMMRLSGSLQDRFGARRLLVFVVAVTSLRWLGLAATEGAASFIALQALHGVSFGLFYPTMVSVVAERVPEEARQGSQGLFASLFFGVGGALGMGAAGAVFERYGETATWLAMALFSTGAVLVSLLLEREEER